VLLGGAIPDPSRFGLDIVFPAAMGGLAVGLTTGRRELVAAGAGAIIGTGMSLLIGPALGIMVGGLLGPFLGMAVPAPPEPPASPDSEIAGTPVAIDEAIAEVGALGGGAAP